MKMKTLVLMRHGQTLFNQKHRIQGWCDSPLTPLGIAQAKNAAKFVDGLNLDFDYYVSSPLERTCDTLETVMPGVQYERNAGLKEINFGRYEGEPEVMNPPLEFYSPFFASAQGETREQTGKRMYDTLADIMDDPDHNTVFALSHGGAMKNFAGLCEQTGNVTMKDRFQNCCVMVCDYDPDTRTFIWKELFNEVYDEAAWKKDQKAQSAELESQTNGTDAKIAASHEGKGVPAAPSAKDPADNLDPSIPTPKKKRLVLVRHGKTLFNEKEMVQGWCDSPLTQKGAEKIKKYRHVLEPYANQADHLYCSTSDRTAQTLELITDKPYTRRKDLKECCYGIFEGENQLVGIEDEQWEINEIKNPYEPRQAGYARFEQAVRNLMDQEDHENVFIVAHGDVIYHFAQNQPTTLGEESKIFTHNGAGLVFEYDPVHQTFLWTEYFNPEN